MAKSVKITVHGTPQPAGSKRAFVRPGAQFASVVDANPKAKGWKDSVASCCATQYGGPLLDGPLDVVVVFFAPRPKAHFGTGRNAGVLKPTAPEWPTVKPDIDKLSRAVLDGLTGQLYRDDSQVVRKLAEKRYGDPARVEIQVTQLEESS